MGKTNSKITAVNRYGKFYFVFEHNGKKKYYRSPTEGLEVATDPITGALVPINPIQETRQILSTELAAGLKKFRANFKTYAEAYWDLAPYPTVDELRRKGALRPDLGFPDHLLSVDEDVLFDLVKHLKANSWTRTARWDNARNRHISNYEFIDRDVIIKRGLQRFTRAIYNKFANRHPREAVPLGELAPEDRYRS